MKNRDGKNNFYRQLNLGDDVKKILKWYRKAKVDLMNDKYQEEDLNDKENKQT